MLDLLLDAGSWAALFSVTSMLMLSVDLCQGFLERKRDQAPVVLHRRKKQGPRASVPGWEYDDADPVVAVITPRRGAGGPPA